MLSVCLVVSLLVLGGRGYELCDYQHNGDLKASYKVYLNLSWFDAVKQCTRDGATLAYPRHEAEAQYMNSLLDKGWKDSIFVAATDIYEPKHFRSIDGVSIEDLYHHPWFHGASRYAYEQNCVVLMKVGSDDPLTFFYDDNCKAHHQAICWKLDEKEIKVTAKLATTETPVADGYQYEASLGAYYKPYYAVSWYEAFARCSKDGATLAYPRNEEEARYLHSLRHYHVVLVGASDLFQEGIFRTVDGRLLDDVYHPWNINEPNNLEEENCVVLMERRTMVINDVPCANRLDAVCRVLALGNTSDSGTTPESTKAITEQPRDEVVPDTDPLSSDDGYIYNAGLGASYKAYSDLSWYEAFAKCSRDGATLAYPRHEADALHIYSSAVSDGRTHATFLGATDFYEEGKFRIVNGLPIDNLYHQWIEGKPYVKDDKHCVVLVNVGELSQTILRVDVVNCALHNDAVCWKPDIHSDTSAIALAKTQISKLPDYKYENSLDAYYKPYHLVTWYEAFKRCSDDGATIAYPRNEKEAFHMYSLRESRVVFLGATDFYEEGIFRTLDAKLVNDLYHPWNQGEPNNIGEEDCLVLMDVGTMVINDARCQNQLDVVCRILPVRTKPALDQPTNLTMSTPTTFRLPPESFYVESTSTEQYPSTKTIPSTKKKYSDIGFEFNAELKASYRAYFNVDWFLAFALCARSGARLAYPRHKAEARHMHSLVIGDRNAHAIHVGATDFFQKGTFRTTEGELLQNLYQPWIEKTPNDIGKHCVTLFTIGDPGRNNTFKIDVSVCLASYAAVCRKLDKDITTTSPSLPIDISTHAGYQYEENLDSYYKPYHNVSWYEAFAKCSQDGASIAFPKHDVEALHLYTLTKSHKIFLGATDVYQEGTFRTIDGNLVHEGYHPWSVGEPNNRFGADCVTLANVGRADAALDLRLVSAQCTARLDAVCRRLRRWPPGDRVLAVLVHPSPPPPPVAPTTKPLLISTEPSSPISPTDSLQISNSGTTDAAVGVAAILAPGPANADGFAYDSELKAQYRVYHNVRWLEAYMECERADALLAYPRRELDARRLYALAAHGGGGRLYLGAEDLFQEGTFSTVGGELVSDGYHPWLVGEPTLKAGKHCITLVAASEGGKPRSLGIKTDFCHSIYDAVCWRLDPPANSTSGSADAAGVGSGAELGAATEAAADGTLAWWAAAALPALAVGAFCCYRARKGKASANFREPLSIFRQLDRSRARYGRAPSAGEQLNVSGTEAEPPSPNQHDEFINILSMRG